jgi:chemotaxis protein CheD
MADIEVRMGDIMVLEGSQNLITSGVGSCLVVTLYDPKLQIGALAHTMLPSRARHNTDDEQSISASLPFGASSSGQKCMVAERTSVKAEDTKYVDVAIDKMLRRLGAKGAKRGDLEAKLFGGANMFPSFFLGTNDIGKENVLSAKDKLKKEGIRVVGECVGGSQGRSVEFSPATGVVTVKVKF